MLRYLFYRAYRNRARDPNETHPQVGAIIGWSFLTGFYLIPLVLYASRSGNSWVPLFVVRHPSITGMIGGAILMLTAYLRWVRDGSYLRLEGLYEREPGLLKRLRAVGFWLYIAGMPVALIVAVVLVRRRG